MSPVRPDASAFRFVIRTTCASAMLCSIACSSVEEAPPDLNSGPAGGQAGDASTDASLGGHSDAAGASGSGEAGLGGTAGIGGMQGDGGSPGSGGVPGDGGFSGSAGDTGSGGIAGSGGDTGSGGIAGSGGDTGSGGIAGSGGDTGSGGNNGLGGNPGSGGEAGAGGIVGSGGSATGGAGNGGSSGQAGTPGTGGAAGPGGSAVVYDGRFIDYSPSSTDQAVIFGHKHAFLHQSTGQYILDAIPAVAGYASPDTSRIRSIQSAPEQVGNGINELWFSTSDVLQKINDFATFVNEGTNGTYYETFLFKYCFLDQWQTAHASQTPQEVLSQYKQTVSALQAKYPGRKFVHATWPLYEDVGWTEQDNVRHGGYNQLLRLEYGGKEPIFDLADIEATKADGTKCTFVESGTSNIWPAFCPGEAEPDHGHPGPAASARLARVLLYMLHDLYK